MEEDLPTGFEQDEETDEFGVGDFVYADGSRRYGRDPELARDLVTRGAAAPPSILPDEPEEPLDLDAEQATVAAPLEAEAPAPEPEAAPEELAEQEPAPSRQSAIMETAGNAGLVPARLDVSQRASEGRTVSGGLPEDMAKRQQDRYVEAATAYRDSVDDQRFREAARLAERAAGAIEAGKLKELEGAAELDQQKKREERARTRAKEVAETPINSRRAWDDAGAFNKAMGSLAVFLGGLSGRMLGGDNQALKNIKDAMREDTQDQLANRNSQVAYWTRELGDAQAGAAAAELKKWQGVKERLQGNLVDEQSREVLERGAVLLKQIDLEIATNLNTLEKANYGNEVRSEQLERGEAATLAAPKPTGGPAAPRVLSAMTAEDESYKRAGLAEVFPGMNENQRNEAWVKFSNNVETNERASAAAKTALDALQQYKQSGDVAGFGPLAKYIPTDLASKDANTQRQLVGNAVFSFIKAQSGAAFTEQEYARRLEIALGKGDFDSMNTGLNMMLQDSRIATGALRSQAPGLFEIRDTLLKRQGARAAAGSRGKAEQDALRQRVTPSKPAPEPVAPAREKKAREVGSPYGRRSPL